MHYTQPEVYEFISKQTGDPIVEWKICAVSGTKFPITQKDLEFYDKVSPTFGGKKYQIPTPRLCPEERQRRRLLWRNERKIYASHSSYSGKKIMSIYRPGTPYKVFSADEWFGDTRNGTDYEREVEWDTSILDQLYKLSREVPHLSTYSTLATNSKFSHATAHAKNCYLSFHIGHSQDCLYCYVCMNLQNCIDCHLTFDSSLCYQCVNVHKSHAVFFGTNSYECTNSWYIDECAQCSNCFGCKGLVNQEYMIFNKQYEKDEYFELVKKIRQKFSHEEILEKHQYELKNYPNRQMYIDKSENSYGTYLGYCNNTIFGYASNHTDECKYVLNVNHATMCMDYDIYGDTSELIYESIMTGTNTYKNLFCIGTRESSSNNLYCLFMVQSSNCFGCVGLKSKSYCIFNKQFAKEEYETIVPKIIKKMTDDGERGEFWGHSSSPFTYNETMANDFYSLNKEEASEKGYGWSDDAYSVNIPKDMSRKKYGSEVSASDVGDEILHEAIICEISESPFRIIKQELEFYRKYDLNLPTKHPDVRHQERLVKRPGRTLYLRTCDKTLEEIISVYPPEFEGKVYSEKAYREEIYG